MYWLSAKTDHGGLLTILAKSIVSEKHCVMLGSWEKKSAALIYTASQPEWKGLFSQPATLGRIKILCRSF